eukprot:gnl/TRDRNA2_/TRDRNA2_83478_c0_seq2.p2 gnl/TRDRNA2_/TRDRNA2_83478_c0~~gnl/TRDRNA2_/TRDRNA2_83478_c0_seq2.p2  ORF type:complete len:126 (+),score=32.66 gnl/TRDRNA2_/TRDRNA2_83478_c0_seq2:136-513(+)
MFAACHSFQPRRLVEHLLWLIVICSTAHADEDCDASKKIELSDITGLIRIISINIRDSDTQLLDAHDDTDVDASDNREAESEWQAAPNTENDDDNDGLKADASIGGPEADASTGGAEADASTGGA